MSKFFVLYRWMDLFNKAFNFFSNIVLNRRATKKSLTNGRGSWVVGRGSWVVGRGSWVVGVGVSTPFAVHLSKIYNHLRQQLKL